MSKVNVIPKNKNQKTPLHRKLDFLDNLKENAFFQWVEENGKYLPYIIGVLFVLIVLIFKFSFTRETKAESRYVQAENSFSMLISSIQNTKDSSLTDLDKLTEIIAAYPTLQSKYDGQIAQLLLASDHPKSAKKFADRTLERTKSDNTPFYHQFAKTSLLLSSGDFEQALKESSQLKLKMSELIQTQKEENTDVNRTPLLFVYNLLRIAMIEIATENPSGEKEAWKTWKSYSENTKDPALANAFATISAQFTEGSYTLNQFIEYREQRLNQQLKK